MDDRQFKPPSLTQHFEAPDDFRGVFGWVCGYSADVGFLDDAVERFTRHSRAQRAFGGRVALALLLDPGNPQISPIEVPGVMHLPIKTDRQPFKLLHAKVALLAFRHVIDGHHWQLRLIVSTGNWTRETLEDSLDIAWRVDLDSKDLESDSVDDLHLQTCVDIKAAWEMLAWLRTHFDLTVFDAVPRGREDTETSTAYRQYENWVNSIHVKSHGFKTQFFDNRRSPLLDQIPTLVKSAAGDVRRNYIAMGSGFYETATLGGKMPKVLEKTVDLLQKHNLLTKDPEVDVFVNPLNCQAVANALTAFSSRGWKIREAGKPVFFGKAVRSLHAKFLFSANSRDNSDVCNSSWLYLGSGNLTVPGFTNRMDPTLGNLEAGVVLVPRDLRWRPTRGVPPQNIVTNVLPVQWDDDLNQSEGALAAGSDMADREGQFFAAPAPCLFWSSSQNGGWLRAPQGVLTSFEVLDETGSICAHEPSRGHFWPGGRPRQVRLRWTVDEQQRSALVPVVDEFGRVAATTLPVIDIDEAWWQLANFPMPPDDEALAPNGDDAPLESDKQKGVGGASIEAAYPVRQMMQLIENIAAKQTLVMQADWQTWCVRFEQCLVQAAASPALKAFLELGINPLSPLWCGPFRPDFAATAEQPEGQRYEQVLTIVEEAWNVGRLRDMGPPT